MTRKPRSVQREDAERLSDGEAAEVWAAREVTPELLRAGREDAEVQEVARALRGAPRQPKAVMATSLRLDRDLESRLRVVAARKGVPYQTLLKDFVRERLYEEEKRLGLL